MKKLFFVLSLVAMALTATAVPAKRGVWKTLTLADGTEVKAQLVGDEYGHYWKAVDGKAYHNVEGADFFQEIDASAIEQKARLRRGQVNAQRVKRLAARRKAASYTGKKKGLILLVNFSDMQFKSEDDNALYQRIANEEGFSEGNFKGSMCDYFKAQSLGKFELDFDVVGPLTVSKSYAYYGENDADGNDMYAGEMVCEAVGLAKDQVTNWAQYDWDDDGYVDQVYVVYAGQGEADGGAENTIWPHAYDLESAAYYGDGTGAVTVATGLQVNTYACGAELDGFTSDVAGIGTMCHEFSHCLGYPDFYDTDYSGGQGMFVWDLMDSGSYNGDGYQPAGYTSYERWVAGWTEPVELSSEDVAVTSMKSLQSSGESYIIYNKRQRNEYFLLENRQLDGWDASLPSAGLLILHVDYDADAWQENTPNDEPSHQRMTWIAADNKYQYEMYQGDKYYTWDGCVNDPFPYGSVNAFNKSTTPAAKLFNKNADGTYYLSSSVEGITQNSDGTVAFNFVADYTGSGEEPYVKPDVEGALFYESFDQCNGKGGNDDAWSGSVATAAFSPDNTGWVAEKAYGAAQCAKFGTGSVSGSATTPAIAINGTATLTFRAGAWNAGGDGTTLNLSVSGGATISPATVTMTKGEFSDFTATITGTGDVKVTFESTKGRFFLDEVIVVDPNGSDTPDNPDTLDEETLKKADWDGDGKFTVNDVIYFIDLYRNYNPAK